MKLKRTVLAIAAASLIGLTVAPSPSEAQGWRGGGARFGGWGGRGWGGRGWGGGWGGVGLGAAVGLGLGLAATSAWGGYPGYYGYGYSGYGYPGYGYASYGYPSYGYSGYAAYPGGWGGSSCLRQVWWRGALRWRNYC